MQHQFAVLIGIEHPDEKPRPEDLKGLEYELLGFLRTAEADADLENQLGLINLLRGAEADTLNLLFSWAIRLHVCTEAGEFTMDRFDANPLLKLLSDVLPDQLPEVIVKHFFNTEGKGKIRALTINTQKKGLETAYKTTLGMLRSRVENAPALEYDEADVEVLKGVGQKIVGALLSFVLADLTPLHPTIQQWLIRWQASMAAAGELVDNIHEIAGEA